MIALGAPVKDSTSSSSGKDTSHKDTSAIPPESGLLVVVLIVIALVAAVLTWRFGLFKKIKNRFRKKKSENDESLDETGE